MESGKAEIKLQHLIISNPLKVIQAKYNQNMIKYFWTATRMKYCISFHLSEF